MIRTISLLFLLMIAGSVSAKKFVPGMVFTLKGDTLLGKIQINGKPCKLNNKARHDLSLAIEFLDAKGEQHSYRPRDIQGYAILCKGKVSDRFVSLILENEVTSDDLGYAGLFGLGETVNEVFGQVISEDGFVKQYRFTGYATGFGANGMPAGNIYTLTLLKKTTERTAFVLSGRFNASRKKLQEYLGDYPKAKAVLDNPKFSIKKNLTYLLADYNRWHAENKQGK